jgi:hypothetical protein
MSRPDPGAIPVIRAENHVDLKFGQGLRHEELLFIGIYLALSELCLLINPQPRAAWWPLAPTGPGLDYAGLSGLS